MLYLTKQKITKIYTIFALCFVFLYMYISLNDCHAHMPAVNNNN